MTGLVVDSSVAAKWFLIEPFSGQALSLLKSGFELAAPSILLVELDNVLVKRIRAELLARELAEAIRVALRRMPIRIHDFAPLLDAAFDLAVRTRQTVYDCLFLALATLVDGQMVTADRRFYDGIPPGRLRERLLWIGDVGSMSDGL